MNTTGRLRVALALTAGFMVVEAVTGWWTGSLALLSDAAHMSTDAASLAVALFAGRIAALPADADHPQGHGRAEVLAAGVTAGALVVVAAWIAVEAVDRLLAPSAVSAGPVAVVAALGLVLNVVMALLLRDAGGLHARAALANVVGDALGSVGALVSGAVVLWTGWTPADSLASLCIAALVAVGAVRVLGEVGRVLMQGVPTGVDLDALRACVGAVPGVAASHDLFVWELRPGEAFVSVHVELRQGSDAVDVCERVHDALAAALPQAHVTVQPERSPTA